MAISVIIPTYKEPEHLELCIQSALDNASNGDNEIIVYVDGTGDLEGNQRVIETFRERVVFLIAKENKGMCVGMNTAVMFAHNRPCLVVNDDHVFPKNWDWELEKHIEPRRILVPNTIERAPSCLWGIETQNFGAFPREFRMQDFLKESIKPELEKDISQDVWRLPFLVDKFEYMALGGWDPNCTHGLYADVEFFVKAKILGIEALYLPNIRFYHFASVAVNNESLAKEGKDSRDLGGAKAAYYLDQKWGGFSPRVLGGKEAHLLYNNQIIV